MAFDPQILNDLSNQRDLANGEVQKKQAEYTDANQFYQETEQAASYGLGNFRTEEQEARQEQQGLKAAINASDQYANQLNASARNIALQERQVAGQFDLANYFREDFIQNIADELEKYILETWGKLGNNLLELLAFLSGISFMFGRAIAGLQTRQIALNLTQFGSPTRVNDQYSTQLAQAQNAEQNLNAQKAKQEQDQSDPYYQNKTGEAQTQLANAQQEAAAAKQKADQAAAEKNEAKYAYEQARNNANAAQRAANDVEAQLREEQLKAQQQQTV